MDCSRNRRGLIRNNLLTMKESLEDFLKRMHMEDEPTVLDDDLPDAFDAWVSELGPDLLIAYAEKWHSEQQMITVSEVLNT